MDLLKDRLAHIMRAKNLTATQFAEMMHIQPSNVSHLLSGRNKPSLDFLIKLKELFPEYNFDWIIMGKKPITVSEQSRTQNNLIQEVVENPKLFDVEIHDVANISDELKDLDNKFVENKVFNNNVASNNVTCNNIKQIIYIYDDGTFDVFNKR